MADLRRYQPRRQSSSAGHGGRWLVIGGAIVLVLVVWKFGFSRSPSTPANTNTTNTDIQLITDAVNATNTTAVANTNADANTNTATTAVPSSGSWQGFSVKQCPAAISSAGSAKQVVLTIGVSAANEQATQAIAALKQAGVSADFFVTGSFASKNADLVKSIAQAGFAVYSQSYDSTSLTSLSATGVSTAITKAETAIVAATGISSKPIFRPPAGDYNASTLTALQAQGYCAVLWTVDAYDWQDGMTAAQSQDRVMTALNKQTGGSIISLHAGYDVTPQLLTDLVGTLKSAGYSIVSLATLLNS